MNHFILGLFSMLIRILAVFVVMVSMPQIGNADIVTRAALFGDSFSNNTVDWPSYAGIPMTRFAVGGRWLSQIANDYESQLSTVSNYDGVIVMAGINDVFGGRSLAGLQSSVLSIIEDTPNGKQLIFATIPPAGNHSSWDSAKQAVADDFNIWINSIAGISVFDVNSVLDSNGDDNLDSEWDSGDGLHPSNGPSGGAGHIANAFINFNAVPEPTAGIVLLMGCISLVLKRRERILS